MGGGVQGNCGVTREVWLAASQPVPAAADGLVSGISQEQGTVMGA